MPGGSSVSIDFQLGFGGADPPPKEVGSVTFPVETISQVVGRHVFYNDSAFDGSNVNPTPADDAAIAIDKTPLMPDGIASAANYTSFLSGINAVMIDVDRLPRPLELDAGDFEFRMGNDSDPANWPAAPQPNNVLIRPAAGPDQADRIMLTWPDESIVDNWLQVTLLPTDESGLAAADVFYFGNAVGETGNRTSDALVTAADVIAVRDHPHGPANRATITNPHDINRDQLVDAADLLAVRDAVNSPFTALRLIDLSSPSPTPVPEPSALMLLLVALSFFCRRVFLGFASRQRRI